MKIFVELILRKFGGFYVIKINLVHIQNIGGNLYIDRYFKGPPTLSADLYKISNLYIIKNTHLNLYLIEFKKIFNFEDPSIGEHKNKSGYFYTYSFFFATNLIQWELFASNHLKFEFNLFVVSQNLKSITEKFPTCSVVEITSSKIDPKLDSWRCRQFM